MYLLYHSSESFLFDLLSLLSLKERKKKGMGYDVTMYVFGAFIPLIYGNTILFDMSETVSDVKDSFFPINLTTCTLFPN